MSVNIPTHYATEYARNIDLLLQQEQSRLSGTVMQGNHVGEKASPVDQIGAVEMQDVVTRFAPMPRVDATMARRWVSPISSDLPQLIDTFDALKLLTDPKSKYVQNAVQAANRRKDRHIIGAFFADAAIGVAGAGTETFGTTLTTSAGQNVSVGTGGAASGMNVAKLKAGVKRLMEANVDVDAETVHCAFKAKQHDELLSEIQVIGREFGVPVLGDNKTLKRWWVIQFHHTELLQDGTDDAAGTSTMCPMWVERGMHYGNWQSQVNDISRRNDIQGLPWQAYLMMTGGATRTEKERVIRIWCR
jgi:hypothetical protein